MAGVPVVFRGGGKPVVNSYSFTEIATGIGVITMNGYQVNLSGSTISEHLSPTEIYSEPKGQGIDANYASVTLADTLNYDTIVFDYPMIVKGIATVMVNFGGVCPSGSYGHSAYLVVDLVKVATDGSTETTIGTATTNTLSTGSATTTYKRNTLKLSLTETQIRPNEKLRLKVKVYAVRTDAVGGTVFVFNDPQNRSMTSAIDGIDVDSSVYPTKLELYLPVKISL